MNIGKTLFAQLMDFLPWSTFARILRATVATPSGADALLRRAIPSDGVRAIDLSREPARYRGLTVGSSPKSHGFSRTGPTIDPGGRERGARLFTLNSLIG